MTASDIQEIRAMLLQFERSDLQDFYVRLPQWTLFLARPGGAPNPLRATTPAPASVSAQAPAPVATLTAPHLGIFAPRVQAGDTVGAGAAVASIDVLGRKTEVQSPTAGRISRIAAAAGSLIEFGDSLVEISAA